MFSRIAPADICFSRRIAVPLASGYDQDFGRLAVPDQLAYLIGNDEVTIRARNVVSRGGEIDANAGNLTIDAAQRIDIATVRTGQLHYESRCLFTCSKSASSTVTPNGGTINSANGIHLIAGTEVLNAGGRVLALNDLVIDAPLVTARAVPMFSTLGVQPGLAGDFGTSWGRIYATDQGGSFTANRGRLIINGAVVIEGGSLDAANGVSARDGVTTSHDAAHDPVTLESHLGLFDWLW